MALQLGVVTSHMYQWSINGVTNPNPLHVTVCSFETSTFTGLKGIICWNIELFIAIARKFSSAKRHEVNNLQPKEEYKIDNSNILCPGCHYKYCGSKRRKLIPLSAFFSACMTVN
jgi:hypothetical protein